MRNLLDASVDELDVIAFCNKCGHVHRTAVHVGTTDRAVEVVRLLLRDVYGWWTDSLVDLCPACAPR
ncbi:hypothetical protein [Rhodococcus sp. HNM0569]|uniref:hypothetical protein n=1 Tax=Rhodococcus sp. HNM0569 TaxID=2716340 RepID=UPI00146D0FE6|nr:hypothetical protein [Rhodococcus sp. HNM0569]NLU81618.1 hypothetical protein [Rhodococcus sp. HNM0569]